MDAGYQVTAIDGSEACCRWAEDYIGQAVLCQTFDELGFLTRSFDGVWACASLLHVPYAKLTGKSLEKLSRALKPGGILYASFKYGDFEGERNDRYFTDLTEERLAGVVGTGGGSLAVVETFVTGDVRDGRDGEKVAECNWEENIKMARIKWTKEETRFVLFILE